MLVLDPLARAMTPYRPSLPTIIETPAPRKGDGRLEELVGPYRVY